jgi:hypothetical protein
MNARSWCGLLLGTLMVPAAATVVASLSKSGDAAYLVGDTQVYQPVVSDRSTPSIPVDVDGGGATSPHGERDSLLASERCEVDNCARLRLAVLSRIEAGRPGRAALYGDGSDSGSMTLLDFGLMLLIAVALLAYQLDRKQRVLRQASLFFGASRTSGLVSSVR